MAVNGLLPSDPWSLVRVDHSATSCEGGTPEAAAARGRAAE